MDLSEFLLTEDDRLGSISAPDFVKKTVTEPDATSEATFPDGQSKEPLKLPIYPELPRKSYLTGHTDTVYLPAGHGFLFRLDLPAGDNSTLDIMHGNKTIVLK